jgi:hypothetical protein
MASQIQNPRLIISSVTAGRKFWVVKYHRVENFYKSNEERRFFGWIFKSMKEKRLFIDLETRINERMGKLEFSEKQVFWFSLVLAAFSFVSFSGALFLAVPVCLIPLFFFSQDVKMWLPKKM